MAFFKSKKTNEQLRTLSEKEIQEKLYGKFRKSSDLDGASFSVKDSHQALAVEENIESRHDLFASPATNHSPVNLSARKTGVLDTQVKDVKPEPIKPAFERRDRSKEIPPVSDNDIFKTGFKTQKLQTSYAYRQHKTQAVGSLQSLGKSLLQIMTDCIRGFLKVLYWFDFSRFRNRALIYWLGSFLFLALLLGGIHYLNVKRETAMKMPRHRPPVTAVTAQAKSQPTVSQPTRSSAKRIAVPASGPLTKADTASPEPSAVVPGIPGESNAEGLFVIQIATYASEEDAHDLMTQIQEGQLPSFIKPLTRLGGKVYHTVFVGRFKTYQQAQTALVKFQKKEMAKPFQDAFIRTLKLSTE